MPTRRGKKYQGSILCEQSMLKKKTNLNKKVLLIYFWTYEYIRIMQITDLESVYRRAENIRHAKNTWQNCRNFQINPAAKVGSGARDKVRGIKKAYKLSKS